MRQGPAGGGAAFLLVPVNEPLCVKHCLSVFLLLVVVFLLENKKNKIFLVGLSN